MSKKDLEEKLSVERDIFKETLREERERSEKLSQKVHDLQLEIIKINNIKTTGCFKKTALIENSFMHKY